MQIDFTQAVTQPGGNAVNTAVAYQKTLDAFDVYGVLGTQTYFHSLTTNIQLQRLLHDVIGREQTLIPLRPTPQIRQGWYVPTKQEEGYLSYTPDFAPEQYALPGREGRAQDFFVSSTPPETSTWKQLIDRKYLNPNTNIYMAPGRSIVPPEIEDQLLRATDLIAYNASEAIAFLRRKRPAILENIKFDDDSSDLLAMALCIFGPRRALVTNKDKNVSLCDNATGEVITVKPPETAVIQSIIQNSIGRTLGKKEISFTGCGDTLLGVFLALEKLEKTGQIQLSPREQLWLATVISRFHGWSSQPNIEYLRRSDFQNIARTSVAKMAA